MAEYKSYFYDSLGDILTQDWGLDSKLIYDKSYYFALEVFIRGGSWAERYRKAVQKEFMKSLFATERPENLLNRAEALIPTSNLLITRVINNLCQVYNKKPDRDIKPEKVELLDNIDFDDFMDKVHKNAKYVGRLLVRVNFNKDIFLESYYPAFYDTEYTDHKLTKVRILYYKDKEDLRSNGLEVQYKTWTLENNKVIYKLQNQSGFVIEQKETNYTELPFVEVEFNSYNTYDHYDKAGGMSELLYAQLVLNMVQFGGIVSSQYSNISIPVFHNIQATEGTDFGIGSIINPPTYKDDDPVPMVEFVSPNQTYNDVLAFHKTYLEDVMRQLGLPSSMVTDKGALSGTALVVDRKELEEQRSQDIKVLREYEKEIMKKIDMVSEKHGKPYDIKDYSIQYQSLDMVYTIDEEIKRNDYDLQNGFVSIVDVMRERGVDGTDEEIINIINNNKALNARIRQRDVESRDSEQTASSSGTIDENEQSSVSGNIEGTQGNQVRSPEIENPI